MNTGSLISNWIVNISYMLPGSVGRWLRNSTAGMRSTQYDVRNTVDAPGRYRRTVAAAAPPPIERQPQYALGTNTVTASVDQGRRQPAGAADANGGAAAPHRGGGPSASRAHGLVTDAADRRRRFAERDAPGAAHGRSPKTQHYDFRVLSRSVDGNEDSPVIDHGSVALRAGPVLRRMLCWVLLALAVLFSRLAGVVPAEHVWAIGH